MTSIGPGTNSGTRKPWVGVLAAIFLAMYAGAAVAAAGHAPGFWDGFGDGFLSLLKLLASPIAAVTILDPEARDWFYDVGYLLGVLGFSGVAGAAATSAEAQATNSRYNR